LLQTTGKVAQKPPLVQKKSESARVKAFSPGQSEPKLKKEKSKEKHKELSKEKPKAKQTKEEEAKEELITL